jgi:uncharacterized protein YdeI (YjbR/CyaY-like superfamily)
MAIKKRTTATARRKASATKLDSTPILHLPSGAHFHAWLAKNHDSSDGVFLRLTKRGDGSKRGITSPEAVEAALIWGWIDSQARSHDSESWLLRFTRRTSKSPWSKINRARAEALIAAGKMQPSGLLEVERAKRDGRWERAYDSPSTAEVPPDLAAALAKNRRASDFFATLKGSNRYAILHRIHAAKKPETRADRIARFVAMCARGETIHG